MSLTRTRARQVVLAGVIAAVVAAVPGTARPAYPGANGKIAFTSDRDGNYEIYAIAPDGTETNLTNEPAHDESSPAWSPDGKTIAFIRDFSQLFTMDADGGHLTKVADIPGGASRPAWSRDGGHIAFESYTPDGGYDIYLIDVDGTGLANLTNTSSPSGAFPNEYRADWSPTSDEILFTSDRDGSVAGEVAHTYLLSLDDGSQRRLIDDGFAVWSPDGTKIAFARARDGGPFSDIYVASVNDLDHPTRLTDDPSVNYNPHWSPDGSEIVFSSNRTGAYNLWATPAANPGMPRRLTLGGGSDFEPAWQPQPPRGTLTVVMQVVNDDGGTLGPADFTIDVYPDDPTRMITFAGAGAPGHAVSLDPGEYDVGVAPNGYAITHSAGCSGTIAAGDSKTCTVTANDLPTRGTLTVVMQVVNDDGGTLGPSDFTLTVGTFTSADSFPGAGTPGHVLALDPGPYGVWLSNAPVHEYSISWASDCEGTIAAGDSKTCTVTADDLPTQGTLTVIMQVINDDGGTLDPSDFWLLVALGPNWVDAFPGAGRPGHVVRLDPGRYVVAFSYPPTSVYSLSWNNYCEGTIAAGESKTCIIFADDLRSDTVPPTVTCGAADALWHGANVSISCSADDTGSGLADAADASFSLSTTVADGTEDGNASTGSRQICDVAGNCANAGPIAGNKVDRKAPTLAVPADRTIDATSPAGTSVAWIVGASDGADPNPGVTCTPHAGSVFAIGTTTVVCTAIDHVGNTSHRSFKVTVRGAKEQLSNLIQKVVGYSSLPQAVKTQLMAALQSLLAGFDATNATQRQLACNALLTFSRAVQSMSGRTLPASVAADWVADATRIRAVLGC